MSIERTEEYITALINELLKQSKESEWIEFKHNNQDPQMTGEYISALSNSAALHRKTNAYVIWGIDDFSKEMVGTEFRPSKTKKGGEALENWLLRLLEPKIDFNFYETSIDEKNIVLLEIAPAYRHPVRFNGVEYIRFGEHKKKLKDLPEKERELWRVFDNIPFERKIAASDLNESDVLKFLEYTAYFELPAPIFRTSNGYTVCILFAHKELKEMNKQDRVRATYLHACLKYIQNDYMTNTTLRERFGIEVKNRSMVSKIINETLEFEKIKIYDESVGTKAREYVPWWAK